MFPPGLPQHFEQDTAATPHGVLVAMNGENSKTVREPPAWKALPDRRAVYESERGASIPICYTTHIAERSMHFAWAREG